MTTQNSPMQARRTPLPDGAAPPPKPTPEKPQGPYFGRRLEIDIAYFLLAGLAVITMQQFFGGGESHEKVVPYSEYRQLVLKGAGALAVAAGRGRRRPERSALGGCAGLCRPGRDGGG